MPTCVRDLSFDDDPDFCIYGHVWVYYVDHADENTVLVQYLSGKPTFNKRYFEDMLGEAAGMFAISLDDTVDDTRKPDTDARRRAALRSLGYPSWTPMPPS